jgi:hypothetical protein
MIPSISVALPPTKILSLPATARSCRPRTGAANISDARSGVTSEEMASHGRTHRRHVHVESTRDPTQGRGGKHHIHRGAIEKVTSVGSASCGDSAATAPAAKERFYGGARSVPHPHSMSRVDESSRDRRTHSSYANKAQLGHCESSLFGIRDNVSSVMYCLLAL